MFPLLLNFKVKPTRTIADIPTSCWLYIILYICHAPSADPPVDHYAYAADVYPLFLAIPSLYVTLNTIPTFPTLISNAQLAYRLSTFYDDLQEMARMDSSFTSRDAQALIDAYANMLRWVPILYFYTSPANPLYLPFVVIT